MFPQRLWTTSHELSKKQLGNSPLLVKIFQGGVLMYLARMSNFSSSLTYGTSLYKRKTMMLRPLYLKSLTRYER